MTIDKKLTIHSLKLWIQNLFKINGTSDLDILKYLC